MARLLNMFGVVAALLVVAPQSQAAFITTFTGGDLGEGLNFHGGAGYLYATALNTDGSFTVQGLTFAPRSNTTVSSPATPSPFNASSFGGSANDLALRGLLSHPLNDDGMVLTLHGLTAGRSYEVQLLASEVNPNNRNARRRDFDIDFGDDGSDEVSNFNVYANGGNSRTVGSSITQGFTATAPTYRIRLTSSDRDPNFEYPIVAGVTLRQFPSAVPVPPTLFAAVAGAGLLGLRRLRRLA